MTIAKVDEAVRAAVVQVLENDDDVRETVGDALAHRFANRDKTEDRFERLLDELRAQREEQHLRWEEHRREDAARRQESERRWEENNRKWEGNNRKWEGNNRKWEGNNRKWEENQREIRELNQQILAQGEHLDGAIGEIKKLDQTFKQTIGALGARWGLTAESSFRDALKAILVDDFGVKVVNWRRKDTEGVVRGYPAEVELDVIIHNGTLIIVEIKSSMSQSDLDKFLKAALFYEAVNSVKADRLIVISPMVSAGAISRARETGVELYGYPAEIDPHSLQGKGQDA